MGDAVPAGLKPDPAIDEWLRRQHARQVSEWPDRASLLENYRSAIADLETTLRDCPGERWTASVWEVKPSDPWMSPAPEANVPRRSVADMQVFGAFWYIAFHCIFYMDFYLSQLDEKPYRAPRPFGGPEEHDVDKDRVAILPYREYTKTQLLAYLKRGAKKAEAVLGSMTVEQAATRCPATSAHAGKPFGELLRINLEHVREHDSELRTALNR